jgi:hypothetical protein
MSITSSKVAVWNTQKTVQPSGHRCHKHAGSAVAPEFDAPLPVSHISFGPIALAAAIARTSTLRDAPPELLSRLKDSALIDAEILIADGPTFALSPYIASLADTERTSFAAKVGAGIADLYMNVLGYVWRDNAICLGSSLEPHADFLYAGGSVSGHGVVLAEAHGSFATGVSDAKVAAQAERKYLRQVRPYIAERSPHGDVVHGYSLAFGSRPGTPDAFLRLSETLLPKSRQGAPGHPKLPEEPSSPTPTQIALSSHRSNFVLMDALPVAEWIDRTRGARDVPTDTDPIPFVRLQYAGRNFLAYADALSPFHHHFDWRGDLIEVATWRRRLLRPRYHGTPPPLRWFVIEENAGERFLDALSGMIRAGPERVPETLDLPSGDFIGLSTGDDAAGRDGAAYDYALFRDGLALLGNPPPHRIAGLRFWYPNNGLT